MSSTTFAHPRSNQTQTGDDQASKTKPPPNRRKKYLWIAAGLVAVWLIGPMVYLANRNDNTQSSKTPEGSNAETETPTSKTYPTNTLESQKEASTNSAVALTPTLILQHHATAVAFSTDGMKLLGVGENDGVKIWDVTTGKELVNVLDASDGNRPVQGYRAGAFFNDGRNIVLGSSNRPPYAYGAEDGTQQTFAWIGNLTTDGGVQSPVVVVSRDGQRIVTASDDKDAFVCFGYEEIKPQGRLGSTYSFLPHLYEHPKNIGLEQMRNVDISPDGSRLVTSSSEATSIWDTATGTQLCRFSESASEIAIFGADGNHVVTGSFDGTINFWEVATASKLKQLYVNSHAERVFSMACSRDGQHILVAFGPNSGIAEQCETVLLDIKDGHVLARLGDPTYRTVAVTISSDGSRAAAASEDGAIRIYNLP